MTNYGRFLALKSDQQLVLVAARLMGLVKAKRPKKDRKEQKHRVSLIVSGGSDLVSGCSMV